MLADSQGITATDHRYVIAYYRHLKAYLMSDFKARFCIKRAYFREYKLCICLVNLES
jgi:hypothetical protein